MPRHLHCPTYAAARYSRIGSSIIKARIKPRGCRASQINLCRPFRKRGHGASFTAIISPCKPVSSGFPIQPLAGHKQSRSGNLASVSLLQYDNWSALPQCLPDASLIVRAGFQELSANSALNQTRSHRMLGLCAKLDACRLAVLPAVRVQQPVYLLLSGMKHHRCKRESFVESCPVCAQSNCSPGCALYCSSDCQLKPYCVADHSVEPPNQLPARRTPVIWCSWPNE